jgi:hypothetical protein
MSIAPLSAPALTPFGKAVFFEVQFRYGQKSRTLLCAYYVLGGQAKIRPWRNSGHPAQRPITPRRRFPKVVRNSEDKLRRVAPLPPWLVVSISSATAAYRVQAL